MQLPSRRTPTVTLLPTRRHVKLALLSSAALMAATFPGISANGEDGNISPGAIEIDQSSANLYPGASTCSGSSLLPATTVIDWVKDCQTNGDLQVGTSAAAQRATGTASGSWTGSPATTRTSS